MKVVDERGYSYKYLRFLYFRKCKKLIFGLAIQVNITILAYIYLSHFGFMLALIAKDDNLPLNVRDVENVCFIFP